MKWPSTDPAVRFHEKRIKGRPSVRYLGVKIDQHLNFKEHIENVKGVVQRTTTGLYSVSRSGWDLNGRVHKQLYCRAVERSTPARHCGTE